MPCRWDISRCPRTHIAATPCCAPSRRAGALATSFVDAVDEVYDATIPYDVRFFESLDRIVQAEPWLERDKAMIDQLRSIGIEKGKTFKPDAKTKDILNDAAR